MQSDYKDSDPEMLTMHMIFDGVEKFEMSTENYVFNSNEILDVIELDDRTVKIIFLTEMMLKQLSLQPKEWTMQYTKMNKVETYVMLLFSLDDGLPSTPTSSE